MLRGALPWNATAAPASRSSRERTSDDCGVTVYGDAPSFGWNAGSDSDGRMCGVRASS